jgi:DNA-binding CsgD family transcriptional regulator
MRTWQLEARASASQVNVSAVTALIGAVHERAPARGMLDFINQHVDASYLSLTEYVSDEPLRNDGSSVSGLSPTMTEQCFSLYRKHFYRGDRLTETAAQMRSRGERNAITALYCRRDEIRDHGWRHSIYETQHLADRLTLLFAPLPRVAFAINLYRDDALGSFAPSEVETVLGLGPLLVGAHQIAFSRRDAELSDAARQRAARAAFRSRGLSEREAEACAYIGAGLAVAEIAQRMGVAQSSVITLRRRAYAKLGVKDRLALAALIH